MFKKCITLAIATIVVSTLCAMEPHIKTVVKKLERDGKKYIKTTRNIYLNNGKIWNVTVNEEGKKSIIKKKYGDYFMGLHFGKALGNGGWSRWNFFSCLLRVNGKYKNIPAMFLPENVYITQVNDITLAEIVFLLSADGKAGKMSMRIMQFPSYKNWLFVKIKFINSNIEPWRLDFKAYPGSASKPKECERWIATKENKYCVSKSASWLKHPAFNSLVMYNKFAQEKFGNFLVFESAKFSEVVFRAYGASVVVQLHPQKGEKEFKFALSYFADKSVADELPRFLGETQDIICKFMENIDWELKLNTSEFDKVSIETDKLIKDMAAMGTDGKKFEAELNNIKLAFQAAVKSNNINQALAQLKLLKKLKTKISKAAMAQFN